MFEFFREEMQKEKLEAIRFAQEVYDQQTYKVKYEEYLRELAFKDLVDKVKQNKSKYDAMVPIIKEAQEQFKKPKEERFSLELLNEHMQDDFFSENRQFTIKKITSCGYEGYAWNIYYEKYYVEFYIAIPIMEKIDTQNFNSANKGRFEFVVKNPNGCWEVKKASYDMGEVAAFIEKYFALEG